MKVDTYRTHIFTVSAFLLILLMGVFNDVNAQYTIKWLNVGTFHNSYSEGLINREEEPWGNAPLMYPAIDYNSGNSRAQAFWMGAADFTDEDGRHFDYKVAHIGPRSGGDVQFFAQEQQIISKFNPEVTVDGAKSFEKYVYIDEANTSMKSDRIMKVSNNSRIGVKAEMTVNAFSQSYQDNYHIVEYKFTNTGNVDDDDDIELNQTLNGVVIFFIHRYMVHDASSWIRGGGAPWGKFTMNDAVGDGHEDYDVDFRAQYAWAGLNPDNTDFQAIGGPMMFSHWAAAPHDTSGRLAAAQMVGRAIIHSDKSTTDQSDDPNQPSTMGVMGSDDPYLVTDEYNDDLMQIQYVDYMTSGRLYPHHADAVEPEGNFDTPANAPNIFNGVYDEGGWSVIEGHGPYDMAPGESINIVVVDGVSGLSERAKYDLGVAYKAGGADDTAELPYTVGGVEHSMTKNQWALSSRDSLFQTFERAIANYESGYNIPESPYPPQSFTVTSGTDKISLAWEAMSGGPARTAWHVYRAKSTYNFPVIGSTSAEGLGHQLIAELGASESSYDDTDVERGIEYYYFIQAVGAVNEDDTGNTPTGVKLKSNQHWTQTFLPASLKRSAGTSLDAIRVVPNPFHLGAEAEIRWPDKQDKLGFLDVPGNCTIKIYSQLGELISTIEHTDGSGDEYWDHTTSSRQIVASGLYIAHIEDNDSGETTTRKFVIIR